MTHKKLKFLNHLNLTIVAVLLVVLLAIVAPGSAVGEESMLIATGLVTDADNGLPIEGAYLSATYLYPDFEGEELAGEAITTSNGSYMLLDSGGFGASQYRFYASAAGYVPRYLELSWDGTTTLVINFNLTPVRTVATSTVTDANTGLPVANAFVAVSRNDPDNYLLVGDDYTTEDGTYTLLDPFGYGAGDYEFSAYVEGYFFQVTDAYWDGFTPLEIYFDLTPKLVLATGTVMEASTQLPLQGAYIWAIWFDGSKEYWSGRAYTDLAGRYTLYSTPSMSAGVYRFQAGATGYYLASRDSTWDGTTTLLLDFALLPDPPDPPIAAPDSYSVAKNKSLNVAAPGVLANDNDPDSYYLTAIKVTDPVNGKLTLNLVGSFTYTPNKGWTGTDRFTYQAYDGRLYSESATVSIRVVGGGGSGGPR